MPLGRQCVDHYRLLRRYNVFSHDEMVCNMAAKADTLDVVLASAVHHDMVLMIREEAELREKVKKMGVALSRVAKYDHLQDDDRQCICCRTTCYLSAVTCPCSPGVLACLHHVHDLCSCPISNYTLNYRFTLDELYPLMTAVKHRAELYDDWAFRVTHTLDAKLDKKKGLAVFRSLVSESESNVFPNNDLLFRLRLVTEDAEKCSSVAQQLLAGKRPTSNITTTPPQPPPLDHLLHLHHPTTTCGLSRVRCGRRKSPSLLTVEELRSFVRQLYNLPCSLAQAPLLKKLLNDIEDFQQHSEKVLSENVSSVTEIQSLLDVSFDFDVELPELPCLRVKLEQSRWLEGVGVRPSYSSLTLEAMRKLVDQGLGLAAHPTVDKAMARLQELLATSEYWEDKAASLLKASHPLPLETLSTAAVKSASVPAHLPNCLLLQESVRRAREWLQDAEELQAPGCAPTAAALSDAVLRGQDIQVHLEPLQRLEALLAEVQEWKESAVAMFLKKNDPSTLLEVLCPRSVGSPKRKTKEGNSSPQLGKKKPATPPESPVDIQRALSTCKDSSSAMEAMAALRADNESKLLPAADCMDLTVCVCQEAPMGAMLQCELCRDAFHSVCVRDLYDDGATAADRQPWLCPLCRRSEAPPMSEVLPLLAAVQQCCRGGRVRLPEADALHFLVERAVNWQHRARQNADELRLQEMQEGPGTPPTLTRWASGNNNNTATADGHAQELEELMVEGLLLPVSLPETQDLYRALMHRPRSSRPPAGCLSPPHDHASDCTKHVQFSDGQEKSLSWNDDEEGSTLSVSEKNAKRHLERGVGGVASGRRPRKNKKPHYKRQKMSRDKSLERRGASTSSSPRSDFSQSDGSDEEMAVCPAERCQQPEGDEVDWVQCDGRCNQWFHQACVGVTAELAEKEDYVCVGCALGDGPLGP
ncbi:hypothetical protein CRUP_027633 [Coryphaenoides rupestris]|nr:hypothetical protein CRUP_027633 [Coryphaenoides rupestris]